MNEGSNWPVEMLSAHRMWLQGVARALVGDPHEADDLVQEVLIAAMEKPPEKEGSFKSWARTVLRRKASHQCRSRNRRRRREEVVAKAEVIGDAKDLVDQMELQQALGQAILELDEPFRLTVLLHYIEGLSTAEVAARLGVPSSTIRGRLSTALERLRSRMDQSYGSRKSWVGIVTPFLLPKQLSLVSTTQVNLLAFASIVKVILMKKTVGILALVFICMGVFYSNGFLDFMFIQQDEQKQESLSEIAAKSSTIDASSAAKGLKPLNDQKNSLANGERLKTDSSVADSSSNSLVGSAKSSTDNKVEAEPEAVILGHIERSDGESLEGAKVSIWQVGQPMGTVDADGYFTIKTKSDEGATFCLRLENSYILLKDSIRPRFGETVEVELEVEVGEELEVTILDADRREPIKDAKVVIRHVTHRGQGGMLVAKTNADGLATCQYLPKGKYTIEVRHKEYTSQELPATAIPETDKLEFLLKPARKIEVTVVGMEDYPESKWLLLQLQSDGRYFSVEGKPDAEGVFIAHAPPAGKWKYTNRAYGKSPRVSGELVVGEGKDLVRLHVELPSPSGASFEGFLTGPDGEAITEGRTSLGNYSADLNAEGWFKFENLKPRNYRVQWERGKTNRALQITLGRIELAEDDSIERDYRLEGTARVEINFEGVPEHMSHFTGLAAFDPIDESKNQSLSVMEVLHKTSVVQYMPLGRYKLTPHLFGGEVIQLASQEVDIRSDKKVIEIIIEYRKPASLEFVFTVEGDEAIPERVYVNTSGPTGSEGGNLLIQDGKATMSIYNEGAFAIRFSSTKGSLAAIVEEVVVVSGQTQTVQVVLSNKK